MRYVMRDGLRVIVTNRCSGPRSFTLGNNEHDAHDPDFPEGPVYLLFDLADGRYDEMDWYEDYRDAIAVSRAHWPGGVG